MDNMNIYQRKGSISNAHVGKEFECLAKEKLQENGIHVERNFKILIGINNFKKEHAFDLGNKTDKIIVECKSHKWTNGKNVPSAKLTVWNEAMYYFSLTPHDYRKIFFVLYDYSNKRKESLAEYYIRIYYHLIPLDVEIFEYNESKSKYYKIRSKI